METAFRRRRVATSRRWRGDSGGVARCGYSIGMLARWDGKGVAPPSVSKVWRRRQAGAALVGMWRQGGDGVGRCGGDGVSHGISVTATLLCRFWRAGSVGGIRVGDMTVPAVWWCAMALGQCWWHDGVDGRWPGDTCGGLSARALDGVGSMAACGDIGDMVVLTVFGALDVPRSECCAAVCDPGNT